MTLAPQERGAFDDAAAIRPTLAAPRGRSRRVLRRLQPFLRACLGPRLDRGLVYGGLLDQAGIAEKAGDAIGGKSADPEPMLDPLGFEGHPIGVRPVEHRIIGPELLDKAAIARTARVRNDDAVVGAFFGPSARQPDLQRHLVTFS